MEARLTPAAAISRHLRSHWPKGQNVRLIERRPLEMVTHMKTTVDIVGDLLLRAKREAEVSQTTLRSLIEEGCSLHSAAKALTRSATPSMEPRSDDRD